MNPFEPYYKTDFLSTYIKQKERTCFFGCGFITKSGTQVDFKDGYYARWALVYVLRGSGTFIDHLGKSYPIEAGTVFHRNKLMQKNQTA